MSEYDFLKGLQFSGTIDDMRKQYYGGTGKYKPGVASTSGSGIEIQDGSDTRSFLTAEMSGGVPTGNFFVAEPGGEIPVALGGTGTPAVETAATFAAISPSTAPRIVIVIADETNGGERTVYFYDGSTFNWLPTVGVE